ncbi:hypothetical protein HOH45_00455 [bacterium]|nr:hypothetical protein [bacterium]
MINIRIFLCSVSENEIVESMKLFYDYLVRLLIEPSGNERISMIKSRV